MKNAFDMLISRCDIIEERLFELENVSIETSKTEKQREKSLTLLNEESWMKYLKGKKKKNTNLEICSLWNYLPRIKEKQKIKNFFLSVDMFLKKMLKEVQQSDRNYRSETDLYKVRESIKEGIS